MKRKIRSESTGTRTLVFGEVLFDAFPDGTEVLGGAPFNVAWHLQGLGLQPLFVSRIGDDAKGRRVQDAMRSWDMDTAGLQQDDGRPTGTVSVALHAGQHAFDILPDQAYDRIDADTALRAATVGPVDVIYHGTLALRDPVSHAALRALRGKLDARVYVDLNLRSPWWSNAVVADALRDASWVKLNDAELRTVAGAPATTERQQARALRERCGSESVLVTRGERGAFICARDGFVEGAAEPVENLVDTVGAGDAFAAVALAGLTLGWPAQRTLARALEFAAWICGVRGATVADVERYAHYRNAWGLDVRH